MSVPIVAGNVDCTGSEAGLGSCPYSTTLVDCGHHQDAGVRCPELAPVTVSDWSMVAMSTMVGWRCATMDTLEQFVKTTGLLKMQG